jgi:RNA polymerase sigma factor (sigma-70 family)
MATAQLGTLLRHIHKLAAGPRSAHETDRQLLDHFAAQRDESAFTALVARHGPMVLRVCRRVLGHEQDAEDAFQATFLVLAKNSTSIRRREALPGWLHGVAYRIAMKAKRSAARRRNHEARSQRNPVPSRNWVSDPADPSWKEVREALDQEIQALPTHHRSAFVACILEGKSVSEAAAELACKAGTVSCWLARARTCLRRRLSRRGIELTALLAAIAVAESSVAAVPTALAKTTIGFGLSVAAGNSAAGVIPTHIAALAAGVTRAMFLTKTKIAVAILFFAALIGGAGAWVHQALAMPEDDTKADAKRSEETKPQAANEKTGSVSVRGRVLDPEGRSVKGARLIFLYGSSRKYPEKAWATTAADGRFEFPVDNKLLEDPWYENNRDGTYVVAGADGYGCAFAKLPPWTASDVTLQLVKDDVPIQGRLLDLQGKPVAGATVRVDDMVYFAKKDDLEPWLKAATAGEAHSDSHLTTLWSPAYGALIAPVMTATDGTFTIKGVGRERLVNLRIDGPTIVTQQILAMTRTRDMIRVPADKPMAGASATYFGRYAASFDLVVPPTKPIVGKVFDKATGKPLAGVTVHTYFISGMKDIHNNLIRVKTDKDGKYRIVGLPKGQGNRIGTQVDDLPYLPAFESVPDTPGLEPVAVDFALQRGVWVKGRVTDKATGKTVASGIEYFALSDNPHLNNVRLDDTNWHPTMDDGTFRTVVMPGPGILAVRSTYERYRKGIGADRIKGHRLEGGLETLRTRPYLLHPINYHVLVPIDPKPDSESITCDVVLDPGRTLKGNVVGPDGQPLAGAFVTGEKPMSSWSSEPLKDAEFTMESFGDDESRLIQAMHEGKKLAGSLVVQGKDKEPVRIQLEPWGSVTGRLVKPDGEPMTNVVVDIGYHFRVRPGKDGKFRLDGLSRGLKYSVHVVKDPGSGLEISGKNIQDITIKPGETKDLGDIQVKPME